MDTFKTRLIKYFSNLVARIDFECEVFYDWVQNNWTAIQAIASVHEIDEDSPNELGLVDFQTFEELKAHHDEIRIKQIKEIQDFEKYVFDNFDKNKKLLDETTINIEAINELSYDDVAPELSLLERVVFLRGRVYDVRICKRNGDNGPTPIRNKYWAYTHLLNPNYYFTTYTVVDIDKVKFRKHSDLIKEHMYLEICVVVLLGKHEVDRSLDYWGEYYEEGEYSDTIYHHLKIYHSTKLNNIINK